jgi:predicted nucleic acid-binding protein
MRFWDSSAVVPLVVHEKQTDVMRSLLEEDRGIVVWAMTGVEVTSALWRRARAGEIDETARVGAIAALAELELAWNRTIDVVQVGARARRVLATHPLRAADACQLAAALLVCRERTDALDFVTLDDRLAEAARREGLRVLALPE